VKTLILYATKYGAAGEIAQRIAKRIDGAFVHDLKQACTHDLTAFDCIIIGSSVYAGTIRKEVKVFLSKNSSTLQGKKLGLFLSGIGESGEETYFKKNFSSDIIQAAKATGFLGGTFNPQKANFLERFIMRIITKQSGLINTISDRKIEKFVEELKQ